MAVDIEPELSLADYLSIVKRRWLSIVATFFIALLAIVFFGFRLPPVYSAEGIIGIESPTISKSAIGDNIGQATRAKYVDEQVDKLKQKILSRENLIRLNEKHGLFPALTKPADIAEALGESFKLLSQTKSTDGTSWSEKVTVGFSVEFKYSDPDKTYQVTNDVIAQLLDQNSKDRTQRVTETTRFLTVELNKLKDELEVVENKVAAYKQKHANSLPQHQKMHMASLDQMRASLKDIEIEYKTTQEELRYLDVELLTANSRANNGGTGGAEAVSELDKARAELARSKVLYKDTHPTIRALKRKVALLEQAKATPKNKPKKVNLAVELAVAKINTQIETAKVRLTSLAQEKRSMQSSIARLKKQVIEIPQVERGLTTLLRDYENAKRKYEEVKAKQVNAKIAENLELNNKAERFVLIHSPDYPQHKLNLSKSKILILGLIASMVLGLGMAMLLEMMDKRVRGQSTLTALINAKPIAIVPYINTQEEVTKKRNLLNLFYLLLVALVVLVLVLVIVHFFITPLDQVLEQVKGLTG